MNATSPMPVRKRLHLLVPNLDGGDAGLRALDLARHLQRQEGWRVQVTSTTEGPLQFGFIAAGARVSIDHDAAAKRSILPPGTAAPAEAMIVFGTPPPWVQPHVEATSAPALFEEQMIRSGRLAVWFDPRISITARSSIRQKLGLGDTDRAVFVCAAVAKDEAVSFLIRARGWLDRPGLAAWRIFIVDPQGRLGEIKSSGIVEMESDLAGTDAPPWESAADAVVNLRTDGNGDRALLNASAVALPAMAAASGSLPGPFVGIIPPHDPQALAHALIDLTSNPGALARRVASAHWHVMTHHNPAVLIPGLIEALGVHGRAGPVNEG